MDNVYRIDHDGYTDISRDNQPVSYIDMERVSAISYPVRNNYENAVKVYWLAGGSQIFDFSGKQDARQFVAAWEHWCRRSK